MAKRSSVLICATALVTLLAPAAWSGTSVKSSKSNSSDRVVAKNVTASTNLSGASETQTVYTTPAAGTFLLTQVCVGPVNGGMQINASGLGGVVFVMGGSCVSMQGTIMPPSSTITCSTGASASEGSYFCTISGLQSPPPLVFP